MVTVLYIPTVANDRFLSTVPLSPRSAKKMGPRASPSRALRRASTTSAVSMSAMTLSPTTPTASTSAGPAAAVAADHPEAAVQVLYTHPSARIVAFMNHDTTGPFTPETLTPSGRVDRTLATGPLVIYKAPGSVTFLNCGAALKPILPKSQCWAIEEDSSKFVLQVRAPQFWRIEIAVDTPEQVGHAAAFRDILDTILLFDKTPCPFQRSFTVELPDMAEVKKRAWQPVPKSTLTGASVKRPTQAYSPSKPSATRSFSHSPMSSAAAHSVGKSNDSSCGASVTGSGKSSPPQSGIGSHSSATNRIGEVARLTKTFDSQEEISNRLAAVQQSHNRRHSSAASIARAAASSTSNSSGPTTTMATPARRLSRAHGPPPSLSPNNLAGTPGGRRMSVYSDCTASSTVSDAASSLFSSATGGIDASSPVLSPCASVSVTSPTVATASRAARGRPERDKRCRASPLCSDDDDDDDNEEGEDEDENEEQEQEQQDVDVEKHQPKSSVTARATTESLVVGRSRPGLSTFHSLPPSLVSGRPSSSPITTTAFSQRQAAVAGAQGGMTPQLFQRLAVGRVQPGRYLSSLMLRVAERINDGEWRGVVFGVNEAGEKVPVQWDCEDEFADGVAVMTDAVAAGTASHSMAGPEIVGLKNSKKKEDEGKEDDDDEELD